MISLPGSHDLDRLLSILAKSWKIEKVGCSAVKLTRNALRGDLSVSRFMCPTCRLHDQVDSRRIADQDKAAGVCYAKGMAAT